MRICGSIFKIYLINENEKPISDTSDSRNHAVLRMGCEC